MSARRPRWGSSCVPELPSDNLPPILPIGTAVVALVEVRGTDGRALHPRGAAGLIVSSPADAEHSYRVKFPGGDIVSLRRRELEVLSRYQSPGWERRDAQIGADLSQYVVYRCVIGSRAYGLEHDASDVDRRGIYVPPASMHWSVFGVPEQIDTHETQECYWELEKFITLALKANPNVLETLWTPLVEQTDSPADRLRAERSIFLSRLIYQTFNGYALSQFKKIEADVRNHGDVKWKHAMHLLRLLHSGAAALRTGELPVRVEANRAQLLAVRDGLMPWHEVDAWRMSLHAEFDRALESSHLPERPDYERANAILVAARAEMARREGLA